MVREQQMLAYRGAPTLDKDFMNWWMREDSYDDDRPDAAVTEIEIRAALKIIRKKLILAQVTKGLLELHIAFAHLHVVPPPVRVA